MSSDSPAAILFDVNGNPVTIVNGAVAISNISTNSTITSVASSNTDTLILSSNPNRRGIFIYNDTTGATLKIGLGSSTVSATNFSILIIAGGFFEIPFGYTGEIRGIWSVTESSGAVRITELI